jgi:hypothetical protein
MHQTQNCWVLGRFPSSGILENRKHDVSETGSVSVCPPSPEEETDPVSETAMRTSNVTPFNESLFHNSYGATVT